MTDVAQEPKPQPKTVKFGDYELTGKIGQGGIAEIFKARQESLDRDVAIKVLNPKLTKDDDIVRRFERESIVIAKLNHPNIVHVIDKGMAAGRYYFVMEYVNGTSLREVIKSDRIPLKAKFEMLVQVCKALDYAHKNGVIHRDIKPTNILVDRQGNAMVADFGNAQIVGTGDSEMTSADIIMGTMAYMSPEQKISSTNVDQTTDIYAIGVIVYEMLVGKKPLGRFKLPSESDNEIDKRWDGVIQKCLAQDARDRYQTAVELKDAILEIIATSAQPVEHEEFTQDDSDSFLGKCRHLDTISESRFGSTLLVEHRVNKRLYIIRKHGRGEGGKREAMVLSKLKHQNIIDIYGAGGDLRSTVIISAYAQGGSLVDRLARKYTWEKAMGIITQVMAGLSFAHKNNIVHGNMRPSNILFDSDEVVKLTDFAMPAHYEAVKGKKNWYAAPERKKSKLADLYAVGVILHQMLTGMLPGYDSGSNLILGELKKTAPPDIQRMLSKLLAIRVSHRYQNAEQFLLEYDEFEKSRNEVSPRPAPKNVEPAPAQKRIPVVLYPGLAVGIIILTLIILWAAGVFG